MLPAACGGVETSISVSESFRIVVAATPPNESEQRPRRMFSPVAETTVPPVTLPMAEEIRNNRNGAAVYV